MCILSDQMVEYRTGESIHHVIKYKYSEGKKLDKPITWCNKETSRIAWNFQDANHVALSSGGSIQPCKNCIKSIIKELEKEL